MAGTVRAGLLIFFFLTVAQADPPTAEIKIGNVVPYTGSFSKYGAIGRAEAAYFAMINDQGGINGHKIKFISRDSGSDTTKAVELTHQLVEQDQVLLIAGMWGAPANLAVRAYLNNQKVPQLFAAATEPALNDPSHYPWTMGFQPTRKIEGQVYARYILENKPHARIAVLYAQDPSGEEWLAGIHEGLGANSTAAIVKEMSFDYTDPQGFDAAVAALKESGADAFLNLAVGGFATRAIRKAYDIGWHPLQFIPNASISISAFLEPAGLNKAVGVISNARSKGWLRVEERTDPDVRAFLDWMAKYSPDASLRDADYVYGYEVGETIVEVLRKCGGDLTRSNVMKQAASLDFAPGMFRPGIRVTTSPTDYQPVKQLFLVRFEGRDWMPLGK